MEEVLPSIYHSHIINIKAIVFVSYAKKCIDFYKARNVSILQQRLFSAEYFPEYVLNPQEANFEFPTQQG